MTVHDVTARPNFRAETVKSSSVQTELEPHWLMGVSLTQQPVNWFDHLAQAEQKAIPNEHCQNCEDSQIEEISRSD